MILVHYVSAIGPVSVTGQCLTKFFSLVCCILSVCHCLCILCRYIRWPFYATLLSTKLFFLMTSVMMTVTLIMTVTMRKFGGDIMFSPYICALTSMSRPRTKKGEKWRRCCCQPVFKGIMPVLNIAARLGRQREREREKSESYAASQKRCLYSKISFLVKNT